MSKVFDSATFKYHFLRSGNIKLGDSMATWSTLKGDEEIYIEQLGIKVLGTCKNCKDCTKTCYVNKSYARYPSVPYGHARNTIGMRENLAKVFSDLNKQLSHARNKIKLVRINQSGELENSEQVDGWLTLARNNPNTKFYIYTKMYDLVIPYIIENKVPDNFTILFSIWGDNGVAEYESVKDYKCVKAFVYDDGSELKVKPTIYCEAYDEKGHLNHDNTCESCCRCYVNIPDWKAVGCHGH